MIEQSTRTRFLFFPPKEVMGETLPGLPPPSVYQVSGDAGRPLSKFPTAFWVLAGVCETNFLVWSGIWAGSGAGVEAELCRHLL